MQFEGLRTPPLDARSPRIPSPLPLFLLPRSSPLTLIPSSVRSTMLGRNVSLTGETKIMFMGSSSTEIIFHISATAWALWGSKSDFFPSLCQWETSWERKQIGLLERWPDAAVGGSLCVWVCCCMFIVCVRAHHEGGRRKGKDKKRESERIETE